ncbi:hypothetical protein NPIL_171101 [Nephila pilipes]|uniref:Uncharacterized protein n=1 Tax=Nephila pilipes TaxID=299642 RepID=A0A8X6IFY7_NEPPI|nr:hypothetical protein NPIL_171101 [Nephila pilipes]
MIVGKGLASTVGDGEYPTSTLVGFDTVIRATTSNSDLSASGGCLLRIVFCGSSLSNHCDERLRLSYIFSSHRNDLIEKWFGFVAEEEEKESSFVCASVNSCGIHLLFFHFTDLCQNESRDWFCFGYINDNSRALSRIASRSGFQDIPLHLSLRSTV